MARTVKIRRKSRHELEAMEANNRDAYTRGTKRRRLAKEERRAREIQALELRSGGATYDQIAQALHLVDASHAKKVVEGALNRYELEAVKSVVKMDLQRLDEYIMRCTHALRTNGDLHQIDRLMRIMEFRYRLLGINGEDVRALQQEHGIGTTVNIKGGVQIVQARAETEEEFIAKMMGAVGVDPNSPQAQKYLKEHEAGRTGNKLPMLKGSANEDRDHSGDRLLDEEEAADIVDAEIVDEE